MKQTVLVIVALAGAVLAAQPQRLTLAQHDPVSQSQPPQR